MTHRSARRWVIGLVSVVLSAGLLGWLISRADVTRLGAILAAAAWPVLIPAALAVGLAPFCVALRWLGVLRAQRVIDLTYADALRATMVANLLNCVLPSKGGDLAKVGWVRRQVGVTTAAGTVVLERMVDLVILGALGLTGSLLTGVRWGAVVGGALVATVVATAIAIVAVPVHTAPLPTRVRDAARDVQTVFRRWATEPRAILLTMCGALGAWALTAAAFCLLVESLAAEVGWASTLSAYPVAILAGLVPVSLSGIGTRDAAFVVLLRGQVSEEAALLVGIGYTMLAYWWVALIGSPFVIRRIATYVRRTGPEDAGQSGEGGTT
jgi:uncharacterized membrane protein YbhN (UPF0104 family)